MRPPRPSLLLLALSALPERRADSRPSTSLQVRRALHRLRRQQGGVPVRAVPLGRLVLHPARRLSHPPVARLRREGAQARAQVQPQAVHRLPRGAVLPVPQPVPRPDREPEGKGACALSSPVVPSRAASCSHACCAWCWWECADAAAVPRRTSPSSARRSKASARRRRATLPRPAASSRLPSAHDRRSPSHAPASPRSSSRPHLEAPTLAVTRLAHAPSPFLGVPLVLLHHPRSYISPYPYPLRVVPLLASFVVVVGAVRRRPPSYPPAPFPLGLAPSFLSSLPPPCATMSSRRQTRLCARRDTLFDPSARRTTLLVRSSLSLGLRSMRAWVSGAGLLP